MIFQFHNFPCVYSVQFLLEMMPPQVILKCLQYKFLCIKEGL